ncbi:MULTISPECIES: BMP family ABC transporter substrate-binding protein [Bacillus]|uniref:BMP family ABC transporter substrate-binding protein n=1 Tax=Bacillus TaxID=1386 RepID=UPI000BB97E9E|nr:MULTISPECIES: BMP family ABC transporter substrate-binding protein [Bacillus]
MTLFSIIVLLLLTSCGQVSSNDKNKVGLLVPDTINDQVWGTKGYKGLLRIQSTFNLDVFYEEGIEQEEEIKKAVKEFDKKGITFIFGHGNQYAKVFDEIGDDYPHIHFVCFNSTVYGKNVTSLNFKANAMGFFGGMVSGHMTETNKVGIIAAFEWQPEVDGFFEGVSYQNPDATVFIEYTQNWDDPKIALTILKGMLENDVDIVYPAGDGFNVPVINQLKSKGKYAIGFVTDQSDLGENTVLTSTVQHVPELYELVFRNYLSGELSSGSLYFDFEDDVISLGKFSPLVDKPFQEKILQNIETYKETGLLPNEQVKGE